MATTKKNTYTSLTDALNLSKNTSDLECGHPPLTRVVETKPHSLPSLEDLFTNGFDPARRESFEIAKMPETTTAEMSAKEKRFRQFVEKKYALYSDRGGYSCALQAIDFAILSSHGKIANVNRQQIATYIVEHPELFEAALSKGVLFESPELLASALQQHCKRLLEGDLPCGPLELRVISALIDRQIHVHSYDSPYLDEEGEILASQVFGKESVHPPIHLYFNPVSGDYLLMYKNWGEV